MAQTGSLQLQMMRSLTGRDIYLFFYCFIASIRLYKRSVSSAVSQVLHYHLTVATLDS